MGKQLYYKDRVYPINDGETVLDCLLRSKENIPHACKSGVCQSCLMQASSGTIPEKAQAGLKPTFKQRKLFLACQCYPANDLAVADPKDAGLDVKAIIVEKIMLNHNVLKVKLTPEKIFESEPGQYLTLINPDGIARSYSIANNSLTEGIIELHIRLIKNGVMSNWLEKNADIGSEVTLRGPAGNCFYSPDNGNNFPIILVGTGTGLAPLYGIVKEALIKGHKGEIKLFHGALKEDDLYLVEILQTLDTNHDNFTYIPCVLNGDNNTFYKIGDVKEIAISSLPKDKNNVYLFLCGAPEMVNPLKTKAFIAGINSKYIFVDQFLPSK